MDEELREACNNIHETFRIKIKTADNGEIEDILFLKKRVPCFPQGPRQDEIKNSLGIFDVGGIGNEKI